MENVMHRNKTQNTSGAGFVFEENIVFDKEHNKQVPVRITSCIHRDKKRLKIEFSYDQNIIQLIRKIPGCRWSVTMHCWHVPFDSTSISFLNKNILKNKIEFDIVTEEKIDQNNKYNYAAYEKADVILELDHFNDTIYLFFPRRFSKKWINEIKKLDKWSYEFDNKRWLARPVNNNLREIENLFRSLHCKIHLIERTNNKRKYTRPRKILPERLCPRAFIVEMRRRNYSNSTIENYKSQIDYFLYYFKGKAIEELTESEIKEYLIEKIEKGSISYSAQNIIINAIKLYYEISFQRSINNDEMPRPRKMRKLPVVLSKEEIERVLSSVENQKHRLLLSLYYACGLRASEALHLEKRDIDFERNIIYIKQGKGKKDRIVPLPKNLTEQLKVFVKRNNRSNLIFEGQGNNYYSTRSAQEILKKALKRSGTKKQATLHTLRHSYATHLMEAGTDIRIIQELLGHSSSKTTEIYTHVSKKLINDIKSPFDNLNIT